MSLRVGRYETLRAIASGGMATVYLGRAVGAGGFERLVALKMMHPHIASEPEFVAMFLDEARLAARVRHPNVVATIDLVEDPLFLVMEYIDGPSLHLLLRTCAKARRPFPIGIALRIFLDMLGGLHAAHELTGVSGEPLNLVHRDVSPQNVLVGADGVSRITDFGVARAESRLSSTRGTTLKGKIGYMAPEQIRAEQVDRRGDVYAAGVVLWEILTEHRLFKAENEGALIAQILDGPPRGPRSIAPGVPVAIDRVCVRALQSNPDDRYPTAAAFAEALEQAIAASPGVAIASTRAVAALVKELELHAPPEMLAALPASPVSGPPSSSSPRSYRTPMSNPSAQSAASAPVFEPSGATAIGALVSEPPLNRPRVVLRGLIAGGALVGLALAAGALIAASTSGPSPTSAASGSPAISAAPSPVAATPPSADASLDPPPSPSAEGAAGNEGSRKTSEPAGPAPKATRAQGGRSKPSDSAPRGAAPTPNTSPTAFRPMEL